MIVPLTREQRCGHLLQSFRDLVARLRTGIPFGSKGPLSTTAAEHGILRRQLGYTVAMMVEESRIWQVCIFHALEKNLDSINFGVLLHQVMTIADEGDPRLRQAMKCYVESQFTIRFVLKHEVRRTGSACALANRAFRTSAIPALEN
jgi:hypothetical protein